MRIHVKPWQSKDKLAAEEINLRLTGKELAGITVDIQGNKFQLLESRGALYILTTNGKPLVVEPSTANSVFVEYKKDD